MINYNIVMLGNPAKPEEPKKAYSVAQYAEKMTLAEFSEHIADHKSVYDAEDVQAILGKAVKCLLEMLLAGRKVELGKLGDFSLTLQGKGTATAKEYNPDVCVEKVNVVWTPGKQFKNLKEKASFNFVASRDEQAEAKRRAKAQGTETDASEDKDNTEEKTDTQDKTDTSSGGGSPSTDTDSEDGGGAAV